MIRVRRFHVLLSRLLTEGNEAIFCSRRFGILVYLATRALRRLVRFVQAIMRQGRREVLQVRLLSSFGLFRLVP